jgi:hypothetical protein
MNINASTPIVVYDPGLVDPQHVALAGFLGGYRGLTRDAYVLDPSSVRSFLRRVPTGSLRCPQSGIETCGRDLEARGGAMATIARRLE